MEERWYREWRRGRKGWAGPSPARKRQYLEFTGCSAQWVNRKKAQSKPKQPQKNSQTIQLTFKGGCGLGPECSLLWWAMLVLTQTQQQTSTESNTDCPGLTLFMSWTLSRAPSWQNLSKAHIPSLVCCAVIFFAMRMNSSLSNKFWKYAPSHPILLLIVTPQAQGRINNGSHQNKLWKVMNFSKE